MENDLADKPISKKQEQNYLPHMINWFSIRCIGNNENKWKREEKNNNSTFGKAIY